MELSYKQTITLDYLEDDTTEEILFGGSAGGGKSVLGTYWLIKSCLKYPSTRWLMGRAVLKTLKETTLQSFFEVCKLQKLSPNKHFTYNQTSSSIRFFNGSEILLKDLFAYPSDPNFDELGSLEITGAFIDEANQVVKKAKDIVKSRIRYKLDENHIIPKILMTCNPAKNWIYSDFYKPYTKEMLPKNKKFIQSLVTDNPFISRHYINNLQGLDEASKQRLLYGNWDYEDDLLNLMTYDKILDCFSSTYIETGKNYITCDVARYGNDKTVITRWSGLRCEEIHIFEHLATTEVTKQIQKLANKYQIPVSQIVVDEDGVGGGVVDQLRCKGFVNNSRALMDENYQNLKSQCYYLLAKCVNENKVYINSKGEVAEEISKQLSFVKRHNADKDGKLAVLPKDEVKKQLGYSPDLSDALMMRMLFELTPTWYVV